VTTNCELLFKRNPNKTKLTNFGPATKATNVGGLLLLWDPPPSPPPPSRSTTKIIVEGGKKKSTKEKRQTIINVYSFFLLKSKVCIQKGISQ